jgi:hypothetical protein
VQDLVGVGVADAAEERGIGKGALHGVIFAGQHLAKPVERRVQDFQSAAIEGGQSRLTLHHVE